MGNKRPVGLSTLAVAVVIDIHHLFFARTFHSFPLKTFPSLLAGLIPHFCLSSGRDKSEVRDHTFSHYFHPTEYSSSTDILFLPGRTHNASSRTPYFPPSRPGSSPTPFSTQTCPSIRPSPRLPARSVTPAGSCSGPPDAAGKS